MTFTKYVVTQTHYAKNNSNIVEICDSSNVCSSSMMGGSMMSSSMMGGSSKLWQEMLLAIKMVRLTGIEPAQTWRRRPVLYPLSYRRILKYKIDCF